MQMLLVIIICSCVGYLVDMTTDDIFLGAIAAIATGVICGMIIHS